MARSDGDALLLQVSADIRGLEKQFAKAQGVVNTSSKAMERRAQQASTNLERFFGKTDVARAFDKVFDATRFKVLDTGIARVGLFGGALESLGPAGLAAAAAVGAVGAAFAGARAAVKFADNIADTAKRLHVTTDALQEYRYAIRLAGGEEAGADAALEAFSVTLGKAQQGLPKAIKAFKDLGFTQAQVNGFKDADQALRAVVERMTGLSNVQKDAFIARLGLDGLKPLLDDGLASMDRLRTEAHKLGLVMDAELVKRGGELNDQFETVAKVVDIQLKSALVDLGPVLLDLLKLMAGLARAAADVANAFKSIEHKTTAGLERERAALLDQQLQGPDRGAGPLGAQRQARLQARIAAITAQLKSREVAAPAIPTSALDAPAHAAGGGGRSRSAKHVLAGPDPEDLARTREMAALREGIEISEAYANARLTTALSDQLDRLEKIAALRKDGLDLATATAKADAFIATRSEGRALVAQRNVADVPGLTSGEEVLGKLDAAFAALDETGQSLIGTLGDIGVQGFDRLADSLANAIVYGDNLGQTLLGVLRSILAEALSASIKSTFASSGGGIFKFLKTALGAVAGSVGASSGGASTGGGGFGGLTAFASGANFTPGGLSMVGERGPELLNLPRGGQIIPNDILRGMVRGGQGGGGGNRTLAPVIHLTVMGEMSPRDVRRTESQVRAATSRAMATARRQGF